MLRNVVALARPIAFASLLVCSFASVTRAEVVYTYTGSNYTDFSPDNALIPGAYTTSMRVTGSFTVAAPLAPNLSDQNLSPSLSDFSFFDGRSTLSFGSDIVDEFIVSTDNSGQISSWSIQLRTTNYPLPPPGQLGRYISTSLASGDKGEIGTCVLFSTTCVQATYENATSSHGEWSTAPVSAVPLPAPFLLLATALGALGLGGWWRKRAAVAA